MDDDADYLAVESTVAESIDGRNTATWEHEDLAQVRIKVFRGHADSVNSCCYVDDDTKILSASSDGSVRIWDAENGDVKHSYSHGGIVSKAYPNDNGKRFVSSGWDKHVKVWDVESGNILWSGSHAGIVTCCKFSHDGKLVISGSDLDNTLKVWDANSGDLLYNMDDIHVSTITSCIFAPEDDKVITTSMDRSAKFLDLRNEKVTLSLEGHINIVADCDISFDERKFATASWDKSVKIWDVATGGYRSKGPGSLEGSHEGSVSSCHFSNDGLMLVTGSYDSTIVVWDVDNRIQKLKLQGHDDWIEDVCFSSDTSMVLSASRDRTIRMWNIGDSDKIPMVLERRKAIGLQIIRCSVCGKPFSLTQMESFRDNTVCVFCRLKNREKTMVEIMNIVDEQ
ncbi:hypothetical protein FSP39_018946 [Pinctada imbricata]|uniref:WD repeat-containing protein 88 n=1 Tax=Pinctada imbricata TaxID=66713 RepID=A0AA89BXN0_PINIB|nr:hypothetical protein FSP39_018946 [Pinctada imbricata]